jgi:hypothetical protein
VKWAQTGIVFSGTAQFHGLPDQIYYINTGFNLIELGHSVAEL